MKRQLASLLLLISTAAFAADPIALTGTWKVKTNVSGSEGEESCALTRKDAAITGTCTSDQGKSDVTGKVDGNKVSWQYNTKWNDETLTLVFTTTMNSDDNLSGTVDVQPMGVSGDFTATKAK